MSIAAYPTQQQQQQPVGPPQLPYPMYPPGNNMANPAVAVASNPYNPYVPVMSGMPPPPPSYDQAMHHPVAPPNYNASYMPVQVRNVSLLTFLSKFNEQDLFFYSISSSSSSKCP